MLIGKIVSLIPLEESHLETTRKWANNKALQNKILRTMPIYEDGHRKWFTKLTSDSSRIVFAIIFNENYTHIGNCGLQEINYIHRRGMFWIYLGEENFTKQGAGKESLELLLEFSFKRLNLKKIFLHVVSNNNEALSLYKKCSFTQEGVLKKHVYIDGEYLDIMIMSRFN